MRYEIATQGSERWERGEAIWVPGRASSVTVTRRGVTLAMRFIRRNKKTRWGRDLKKLKRSWDLSPDCERAATETVTNWQDFHE